MRKALARIFAVIAIGACGVAVYSVVHSNLHKNHDPAQTTATTPSSSKHSTHHHTPYTVKAGDTLSGIAHRHHVSVAQIKRLNTGLDVHGIQPGQKIQLR